MTIISDAHHIPRFVTVDPLGNLHEVTTMIDRHGRCTFDPIIASTCVVIVQGHHIPQDADDVPIYGVH
jgi:hypothetical protein